METIKIKSSKIALDYCKKKGISKNLFDKMFDKDLKKITNKINCVIK